MLGTVIEGAIVVAMGYEKLSSDQPVWLLMVDRLAPGGEEWIVGRPGRSEDDVPTYRDEAVHYDEQMAWEDFQEKLA